MRSTLLAATLLTSIAAFAQTSDVTTQPTLYLVGYAHLDTQWRWEYPQTIGEFLPRTMHDNFALFEKYPHYVFNFSGANRYRMMKEYYPADYERLKAYVQAGRWFPAGSSMEESDVNSPSAESILRQILYGNRFFKRELGRTSAEYMLPDCFGFPASLPSLLAHAGIEGFSTQKLTWGSSAPVGGEGSPERTPRGTPFNVGVWEGPDGRSVLAAFNPGSYSGDIRYDLSVSDPNNKERGYIDWPARVGRNGEVSGVFADYHYYGTGDVGGAPHESSVAMVETVVSKAADRPSLRVLSSTAEQMFLDIKPDLRVKLPRYRGDLELTNHSAGSLTSEAYQKRWNHENEKLADAAEKASVAAEWLGARPYPLARLNDAWMLVMGGQFHDIAAGTATPQAYEYSWNDDVIALNQFAGVLTSASEGMASALDTRAKGIASVIVYNPLNVPREDIVEVSLASLKIPKDVRVIGPDGAPTPAQVSEGKVLFLARVPPVGYAVYDVQPARQAGASALRVSESSLENARYRIALDANGDIRSIVDKKGDRELLSAPIRLAFQTEKPHDWPAWNMDWNDQKQPPRAFVQGPATVRVVERGPARVAVEIGREAEGSKFVQTIRLAAGNAGNRIEIANAIDWRTSESALKATFPLRASNPKATYNWEVGTIERGNNDEKQFEVPSHDWIDLTDASGAYGVTILTDSKYGSDKPDDRTLRLTLLYTPGLGSGNGRSYSDQTWQDWGHHEFLYGLAAHGGRQAEDWQALRLANPLIAFAGPRHDGAFGKTFSLLRVNDDRVRVLALKKAEEGDSTIVRIVNLDDKPHDDVRLTFAAPLTAAREVNGQELPLGKAAVRDGELVTSLTPFTIRSFAVTLKAPATKLRPPHTEPVALTYDRAIAASPGFDDSGRTLPGEMLPPEIDFAGIRFKTTPNVLVARGQTIPLPKGARAYILAASADGDQRATFRLGDRPVDLSVDLTIEEWTGKIGQWDVRLWAPRTEQLPPRPDAPPNAPPRTRTSLAFNGLTPGFIKGAPVAWFASHRRTAAGLNEPYQYSYLFAYAIDVPPGATTLTLPDNDKVRIVAITMSDEEGGQLQPARSMY